MRSRWENLTPQQLHERAERVMQFARGLGDAFDGFHVGDDLDDLLAGRDPAEVERQLETVRQSLRRGDLTLDDATQQLVRRLSAPPTGEPSADASHRLERIIRRALGSNETLAQAAAKLANEKDNLPPQQTVGAERMQFSRDREEALRFWREGGAQVYEQERYTREEINRAGEVMGRREVSFEEAVRLVRSGR